MIGKAFHPGLHETCPVYGQTADELQIKYRGRLRWVSKADWQVV